MSCTPKPWFVMASGGRRAGGAGRHLESLYSAGVNTEVETIDEGRSRGGRGDRGEERKPPRSPRDLPSSVSILRSPLVSPLPARRHPLAHPPRSPARRESVRIRFRSPQLLEPFVAAAVEAVEVIPDGILLVVILVVLLGGIERARGEDVLGAR